jgi:hypothetical protein
MKLNEIKPIDISQEITEAFDTVLPYKLTDKINHNGALIVIYSIDSDPIIKVQIKAKQIKGLLVGEVSFFTDEHEFEMLNTSSSGQALSIIATVIDVCKKYINQLDILFFTAKLLVPEDNSEEATNKSLKEEKSKSRLYGRLAKKMATQYNLTFQSFTAKGDSGFVLSKDKQLTSTEIINYFGKW